MSRLNSLQIPFSLMIFDRTLCLLKSIHKNCIDETVVIRNCIVCLYGE